DAFRDPSPVEPISCRNYRVHFANQVRRKAWGKVAPSVDGETGTGMDITFGRAGLRPVLIGLAALAVGISVEWPKRLNGSAEPDGFERGASIPVPKRSFVLASLAPSLPPSDAGIARDSAHAESPQRASFAERFAAVFWFQGDDEEEGVVRVEAAAPTADDEE